MSLATLPCRARPSARGAWRGSLCAGKSAEFICQDGLGDFYVWRLSCWPVAKARRPLHKRHQTELIRPAPCLRAGLYPPTAYRVTGTLMGPPEVGQTAGSSAPGQEPAGGLGKSPLLGPLWLKPAASGVRCGVRSPVPGGPSALPHLLSALGAGCKAS